MLKQREHSGGEIHHVEINESKLDQLVGGFVQIASPGLVVGISHHGRPVYRKGFGLASVELQQGLTPGVRMHVGSISKQFAAFGFLLLCESGSASLDDRIEKYFPQFHPVTHGITMRQLLGHTSGLPDACSIRFRLAGFEGRRNCTKEILALYCMLDELQNKPGEKWRYNNAGYMIITEVIEQITGAALEDFLAKNVFSRMGMWDTVLRRHDTEFLANSAAAHTLTAAGGFEERYFGVDPAGAGSVISTADDMLRWLAHMDHPIVGTPETWSLMKKPQVLSNGVSTKYGFGLSHSSYRGIETIGHLGGWIGGNAYALKVPGADLDIVAISNRSDVFTVVVTNRILDASISDLAPVASTGGAGETISMHRLDIDSSVLSNESGSGRLIRRSFHSPRTGRVVQLFARDSLQIVSIDGYDIPFRRQTERDLVPIPAWGSVGQSISLLGNTEDPQSIRLTDFGDVDEFAAIPVGDTAGLRITGRYRSAALDASAEIIVSDGAPHLHMQSNFGSMSYAVEEVGGGYWRMSSGVSILLDAILHLDPDYDALTVNAGTDARLTFQRES